MRGMLPGRRAWTTITAVAIAVGGALLQAVTPAAASRDTLPGDQVDVVLALLLDNTPFGLDTCWFEWDATRLPGVTCTLEKVQPVRKLEQLEAHGTITVARVAAGTHEVRVCGPVPVIDAGDPGKRCSSDTMTVTVRPWTVVPRLVGLGPVPARATAATSRVTLKGLGSGTVATQDPSPGGVVAERSTVVVTMAAPPTSSPPTSSPPTSSPPTSSPPTSSPPTSSPPTSSSTTGSPPTASTTTARPTVLHPARRSSSASRTSSPAAVVGGGTSSPPVGGTTVEGTSATAPPGEGPGVRFTELGPVAGFLLVVLAGVMIRTAARSRRPGGPAPARSVNSPRPARPGPAAHRPGPGPGLQVTLEHDARTRAQFLPPATPGLRLHVVALPGPAVPARLLRGHP